MPGHCSGVARRGAGFVRTKFVRTPEVRALPGMLGSKVSPASAAAKRRFQQNRYVETARTRTTDKVHFVDIEQPSVVPTKFVVTRLTRASTKSQGNYGDSRS